MLFSKIIETYTNTSLPRYTVGGNVNTGSSVWLKGTLVDTVDQTCDLLFLWHIPDPPFSKKLHSHTPAFMDLSVPRNKYSTGFLFYCLAPITPLFRGCVHFHAVDPRRCNTWECVQGRFNEDHFGELEHCLVKAHMDIMRKSWLFTPLTPQTHDQTAI